VLFLCSAAVIVAYNNGYAKSPLLGWQTWCAVGACGTDHCFDGQIRETADALVSTGMRDLGYEWVVLDDCWHPMRGSDGVLVPHASFFPHGMRPVIDYVHSLGLKFGLYTSVGDKTCHGGWSPGSYQHYEQDAQTFASWGVDYVKVDYCGRHDSEGGHKQLSEAMNKTGRPMVLELCRGPYQAEADWGYAPSIAQLWRATGDHHDSWSSLQQQMQSVRGKGSWSGPYGWAYLDMMMTGGQGCEDQYDKSREEWDWTTTRHCPGMTDAEYRTEASLYAIVASPMMVGTDIRNMTAIMKELLLNEEAIAINQDYAAPPGDVQASCAGKGAPEVWVRHLSGGDLAIAMTNVGRSSSTLTVCFDSLRWPQSGSGLARVRDVWGRRDLGVFGSNFSATVGSHDTLLLRLSPVKGPMNEFVV